MDKEEFMKKLMFFQNTSNANNDKKKDFPSFKKNIGTINNNQNKILENTGKSESTSKQNKIFEIAKKFEAANNQNKIIENVTKFNSTSNQNKIIENTRKFDSTNNQNKISVNTREAESTNNKNKVIENTSKTESINQNQNIENVRKFELSNNQNKIIENNRKNETTNIQNKILERSRKRESTNNQNKIIENAIKLESSNNKNQIEENKRKDESTNNQNKKIENTSQIGFNNNQYKIIENTIKFGSSNNQNTIIENIRKDKPTNNQNQNIEYTSESINNLYNILENLQKDDFKDIGDEWLRLYFYIDIKENPLSKYKYFEIGFDKCYYMFVVPERFRFLFTCLYSRIINDSLVLYPKDFHQVKEILDKHEKEEGITENWILISPCVELKKNIQNFHQNKNIYKFIGYCPDINHKHDEDFFLWQFPKFFGIEISSYQLIKTLFKLSNIFYYRKRQNYEIVNDDNAIKLRYDRNVLIDVKNECSKNHVLEEKYVKFFNFRKEDDESYFEFINLYTLLERNIEMKNIVILIYIMGKFPDYVKVMDDDILNKISSSYLLRNYIMLYLYFSNYPYLFGVLTDEEIDNIILSFKPGITLIELSQKCIRGFHSLTFLCDDLCEKIYNGFCILNDKEELKTLQKLLIEIVCASEQISQGIDFYELSKYYQIKNYIRDMDFCLGKFILYILNTYCNYPYKVELIQSYSRKDMRFLYYTLYTQHLKRDNDNNETEELKSLNRSIKYNDTIVIGDEDFHYLIRKMNIPCKNINYLKFNEIETFFQKPKTTKYNKCKYFLIINEKKGIEYIETIKYICNVFCLKIIVIIYIQNKNIKIDKKILETPIMPTILTYSEKDILNYYKDNYDRLKEIKIKYLSEVKIFELLISNNYNYKFTKIDESKIIGEQDNGWELIKNVDDNLFSLVKINNILGFNSLDGFTIDMYQVYKENNCLDLYINYYGNYLGADYVVEQQCSSVAVTKMFLYAYTLEESNGKSYYSLMNNDFRSGNSQKIYRYFPMIRSLYTLIKRKYLKSYSGDVYRAAYFKKELLDEIKPGKKLLNSSLWSSSKKLSVAKSFLFNYKKNILLHTKIKEGNNIDIHSEKLSKYPQEEEILFLPYCYFEVQSFKKVKENNYEYYALELTYCEEENKSNKIENVKVNIVK